jgi:hypothetical protein
MHYLITPQIIQLLHSTGSNPAINRRSTWEVRALEKKPSGHFGDGKNRVVKD